MELGHKLISTMEARFGLVKDPVLLSRLNIILKRLLAQAERSAHALPFKVKVLKLDSINALALVGGTIYIFTGLLDFVKEEFEDSDDVLATIISHEAVHLVKTHVLGLLGLGIG